VRAIFAGRVMRCSACGGELTLTNVIPDDTVAARGVEHHMFICSGCRTTECRVVFTRHGREYDEPLPLHGAVRVRPASTSQDEDTSAPGFFSRVIARIRGH
jgi:hypothetical protein